MAIAGSSTLFWLCSSGQLLVPLSRLEAPSCPPQTGAAKRRRRYAMEDASYFEPIPHPPGHMLVGNLFDIDTAHPMEGLVELARKYGPIYRLDVPGLGSRIIASS